MFLYDHGAGIDILFASFIHNCTSRSEVADMAKSSLGTTLARPRAATLLGLSDTMRLPGRRGSLPSASAADTHYSLGLTWAWRSHCAAMKRAHC